MGVALSERREELDLAEKEVERLRETVNTRHSTLEPIQNDLQAKEADLKEREKKLDERRHAVAVREEKISSVTSEYAAAAERKQQVQNSINAKNALLSQLYDDIYQRQQTLEAIGTGLHEREERAIKAQLSRVVTENSNMVGIPGRDEIEELQLELTAVEIADTAWRERSAALAERERELLA